MGLDQYSISGQPKITMGQVFPVSEVSGMIAREAARRAMCQTQFPWTSHSKLTW